MINGSTVPEKLLHTKRINRSDQISLRRHPRKGGGGMFIRASSSYFIQTHIINPFDMIQGKGITLSLQQELKLS